MHSAVRVTLSSVPTHFTMYLFYRFFLNANQYIFFLTLLIWRRGFCPNCCYIARKCMCGTQGFLRPIPCCLQRVLPLRSWPFLPAFFPTCVSCSCILLYAFSHLSSSRKTKKLWHLEEIGGKSNLRSLGPSRSHAAYRGERDSGIIWTGNFFTAKMAQPWIFFSPLVLSSALMGEWRARAPPARDIRRLRRRLRVMGLS